MALPTKSADRKNMPLARGVLDYFPDALCEVAAVSLAGNKQHNLGPLHWDKSKSTDEADALLRHLVERGKRDTDGMRHSAKAAWRALAMLQREIDTEQVDSVGVVKYKPEDWNAITKQVQDLSLRAEAASSDIRCYSCGASVFDGEDHTRCRGTA